jgi:hypothetical protein
LAAIAVILEQNGKALLTGEAGAFERLRSIVDPIRRAGLMQAQYGAIVDRADRAWEAKDLKEAARLYEEAKPALDVTRQRRLDYLRERKP